MDIRFDREIRDLIRSSGWVIFASYAGGAILFLANAMLASLFGPAGFGVFKTVINLFSFLPAVVDFGISATFVKYIAYSPKEDAGAIIERFLKILAYVYIFCVLAIIIFIKPLAFYFLKDNSLGIMFYAGLALFILYYFEIFKSIIQGFQEFKIYAYSQLLTFCSIGFFAFVLGYYFGIYYGILGWGVGYLIGNAVNMRFLLRQDILSKAKKQIDLKAIFLGYSIPMHLTSIPGFMGLAVIPILSLFFTQRLIGYLAFSMVFYQAFITIPTAFSSVLFPKFSGERHHSVQGNLLRKAFLLYTPIFLSGVFFCFLFSKIFITALFPSYACGLSVFKNVIYFSFVSGYILIYRAFLSAQGRFKMLGFMALIQSLALLCISFLSLRMI